VFVLVKKYVQSLRVKPGFLIWSNLSNQLLFLLIDRVHLGAVTAAVCDTSFT
jgi:hypothetical protein